MCLRSPGVKMSEKCWRGGGKTSEEIFFTSLKNFSYLESAKRIFFTPNQGEDASLRSMCLLYRFFDKLSSHCAFFSVCKRPQERKHHLLGKQLLERYLSWLGFIKCWHICCSRHPRRGRRDKEKFVLSWSQASSRTLLCYHPICSPFAHASLLLLSVVYRNNGSHNESSGQKNTYNKYAMAAPVSADVPKMCTPKLCYLCSEVRGHILHGL